MRRAVHHEPSAGLSVLLLPSWAFYVRDFFLLLGEGDLAGRARPLGASPDPVARRDPITHHCRCAGHNVCCERVQHNVQYWG